MSVTSSLKMWLRLRFLRHPAPKHIQAFCDGELEPRPRRWVQQHLASCKACSTEMNAGIDLLSRIEMLPAAPGEIADVRARLFTAVAAIPPGIVRTDVEYLLGRRAATHPRGPSESLPPALERELQAFLGLRTAARLQASWHAVLR
jgi:anti-sigma factor RsiW